MGPNLDHLTAEKDLPKKFPGEKFVTINSRFCSVAEGQRKLPLYVYKLPPPSTFDFDGRWIPLAQFVEDESVEDVLRVIALLMEVNAVVGLEERLRWDGGGKHICIQRLPWSKRSKKTFFMVGVALDNEGTLIVASRESVSLPNHDGAFDIEELFNG